VKFGAKHEKKKKKTFSLNEDGKNSIPMDEMKKRLITRKLS